MKRIASGFEAVIFTSRWLVAPFMLGLIVGLVGVLYEFVAKLFVFIGLLKTATAAEVIVGILGLVDLTLVANLVLIVICSSYENFLAPINPADHPNWPDGLIGIGFSGLKQKLLGSIVAIASISVLEWFINIDAHVDNVKLAWAVGILIAFAVAMLILAVADRVAGTPTRTNANSKH
jgi:uncharacterized protein (TIGR00645 family)